MLLNKKGFSLVELLAVLVILATIIAIALPSITSSLNRAEEADLEKRKQVILSEAELKVESKLNDTQLSCLRSGNTMIKVDGLVALKVITPNQSKDKNGNKIELCIGYKDNELSIVDCTWSNCVE